ncbi:MAG: ABC transporter ATP-binding protein [Anaerolineaceae bacterium]|nr:ABC transporter ATP-binding protein [Anaerolineaceae bacterium]
MSTNNLSYPPYDLKKVTSQNQLLNFWRIISGWHWHYFGATFFAAVGALARTGMQLFLAYFIDDILIKKQFGEKFLLAIIAFLAIVILQAVASFISGMLSAQTAEGSTRRLRDYLFDHIQRLPYAYHSESKTGDLLERATSDVDTLRRFFADQAIGIGRIILIFVINFVAIYKMNPRLAWVSIIILPVILIVSILFFKSISKAYSAYQDQEAILTTNLQENLSGVRVVKAFARQNYEMEKFDTNNLEKLKRGKKLNTMHAFFWPASDLVCGAQTLASGYLAALMVLDGVITLGQFVAFLGLLSWLIWPIRNLGRLIVDTSRATVSFKRINEIIKQKEENLNNSALPECIEITGNISFDHVSFEYEKDHPVLNDVSFACKAGQVVALLGSTGSGKTSLVNLLPRFYDVTSGKIILDGHDLRDYSRNCLRSQIGIVEQEPFLFSCSIRDNITYGLKRQVSQEEIEKAASEAAIDEVIKGFSKGYDTLVGERGVTLSGGQKQRVAIARTLLINPRILILDDSTSSVDMETEAQIREALENLMKERTTFIIAHRIQSIMDAELILVFDKGCIVQSGKHADLLEQPGIYRNIYEIQTRIDSAVQEEINSVSNL